MGLTEFYNTLPEDIMMLFLLLFPVLEICGLETKWKKSSSLIFLIALLSTLGALIYLLPEQTSVITLFSNHYQVSQKTQLIKIFLLLLSSPLLLIGEKVIIGEFKYHFLLLSLILGTMISVSSSSFITLLIGIELMSIPLYALVLNLDAPLMCAEATMKFIFFDAVITCCYLLGVAFLYCDNGNIFISSPSLIVSDISTSPYFIMGSIFLLFSFIAKLAITPFHFWSPDVYQGSDYKTIYVLTIVKKATMLFILLNLWNGFLAHLLAEKISMLVIVISLLSTMWGNIVLYTQKSLKRIIAYSSIAQMGYLLSILFIKDDAVQSSTLQIYFGLYAISLILVIIPLTQAKIMNTDQLSEVNRLTPFNKVLLVSGLLSLAGVPPFPGFWAKIYLLGYLIDAGQTFVAFTLFLASYLGIYSYFRIVSKFCLENLITPKSTNPMNEI